MIIRSYDHNDIDYINYMGNNLHDNYKFNLDDFSYCLVAVIDNEPIGFITYSIIYDRAEIVDLYIDINYRNKGYAKGLIKKVIEISNSNKCNNITLEVDESNKAAINLYESLGFNIITIRKNYYANANGFLMKKDLR